LGVFGTYLKLEDFKSPEKAGGEEVRIPLKNEAKIKIKQPQNKKEVTSNGCEASYSLD